MFISKISREFTQKHPNSPHGVNGSHFFKIVFWKTKLGVAENTQHNIHPPFIKKMLPPT